MAEIISPNAGPYLVSTAAVAVENTHNFGGGTVQPLEQLAAVGRLCRDHGVGYHLDGARLWNAHVATGVGLADYGRLFDTVSVCFSKGLGAPVGSVLVSTAERIARARVQRKRLGGGWRQAGMLAAGARCTPWTTTSSGWPMITTRPGAWPRPSPSTAPAAVGPGRRGDQHRGAVEPESARRPRSPPRRPRRASWSPPWAREWSARSPTSTSTAISAYAPGTWWACCWAAESWSRGEAQQAAPSGMSMR